MQSCLLAPRGNDNDSFYILSGSWDKKLYLNAFSKAESAGVSNEVANGQHTDWITAVDVADDGKLAISASADKTAGETCDVCCVMCDV